MTLFSKLRTKAAPPKEGHIDASAVDIVDLPDDSRDFPAFSRLLFRPDVTGYGCDVCGREIGLNEVRYHCWWCEDYDCCKACGKNVVHQHSLTLERGSNDELR